MIFDNYLYSIIEYLSYGILFAGIFYFLTHFLSRIKGIFWYAGFTDLQYSIQDTRSYILKILAFPVYSLIVSIILILFDKDVYIVSLISANFIYICFNLFLILFLDRFVLIDKYTFFLTHILSFVINLLLVNFFLLKSPIFEIQTIGYLFPDKDNFKSDFWWFVVGYTLVLLYPKQKERRENTQELKIFINKKLLSYKHRYDKLINNLSSEHQRLIYSIMIYEDYNRSNIDRFFERLVGRLGFLKLKGTMTTGIMQVSSNKILSDKESVQIIVSRLKDTADVEQFLYDYNRFDSTYSYRVKEISEFIRYFCDVKI